MKVVKTNFYINGFHNLGIDPKLYEDFNEGKEIEVTSEKAQELKQKGLITLSKKEIKEVKDGSRDNDQK